jgi:hypothetical protein
MPRCSCGRYRRLGIGQHRRVDRSDARGTHRVFTSSTFTNLGLCHALMGVASHPRRVSTAIPETAPPGSPATAQCDAPSAFVRFRVRVGDDLQIELRRTSRLEVCPPWTSHFSPLTPPNSLLAGESRPWRLCLQRVWQTLSGLQRGVEKCRSESALRLSGAGIRRLWLRPLVP